LHKKISGRKVSRKENPEKLVKKRKSIKMWIENRKCGVGK
jgi:hypothetical protein